MGECEQCRWRRHSPTQRTTHHSSVRRPSRPHAPVPPQFAFGHRTRAKGGQRHRTATIGVFHDESTAVSCTHRNETETGRAAAPNPLRQRETVRAGRCLRKKTCTQESTPRHVSQKYKREAPVQENERDKRLSQSNEIRQNAHRSQSQQRHRRALRNALTRTQLKNQQSTRDRPTRIVAKRGIRVLDHQCQQKQLKEEEKEEKKAIKKSSCFL